MYISSVFVCEVSHHDFCNAAVHMCLSNTCFCRFCENVADLAYLCDQRHEVTVQYQSIKEFMETCSGEKFLNFQYYHLI